MAMFYVAPLPNMWGISHVRCISGPRCTKSFLPPLVDFVMTGVHWALFCSPSVKGLIELSLSAAPVFSF